MVWPRAEYRGKGDTLGVCSSIAAFLLGKMHGEGTEH